MVSKRKGRLLLFTCPNYIYCPTKIRLSFDREKFQKKIERGRTKAESQPYRGGGANTVFRSQIGIPWAMSAPLAQNTVPSTP